PRRDEFVRTHHGEVDVRRDDVLLETADVVRPEIDEASEQRHTRVARRDVDRGDARAVREPPGDRVLAATAAQHETVQPGRARSAVMKSCVATARSATSEP